MGKHEHNLLQPNSTTYFLGALLRLVFYATTDAKAAQMLKCFGVMHQSHTSVSRIRICIVQRRFNSGQEGSVDIPAQ